MSDVSVGFIDEGVARTDVSEENKLDAFIKLIIRIGVVKEELRDNLSYEIL